MTLFIKMKFPAPRPGPHPTARSERAGTKMAVAFANMFMAKVETDTLSQSVLKPLVWKRFIDDVFFNLGR